MTHPLLGDLGYLANMDQADEILLGMYQVSEGTNPCMAKLIAELQRYQSTKDHVSRWKKQKESILADSNGLTFSHYKAGAEDDDIAQFYATLQLLPYQHGFVPKAWIPMIDVEILKKVYDIEKMYTVLLMNAKFNMNNNKTGLGYDDSAEEQGTIVI
jgi:hypothetical protein